MLADKGKIGQIEELKNMREKSKCFICTGKRSGFAMFPCKHTGLCVGCGIKYKSMKLVNQCPLCKRDIEKVYLYKENLETGELGCLGFEDVKDLGGLCL